MLQPTQLRTERLLLRPFQLSDAEDVFAFSSDEEFARFYLSDPVTRQSVDNLIANFIDTTWHDRPHFAVVAGGRVIGEVYFTVHHSDLIGELGYAIAREHWGKGFALEAAQAVLNYGFSTFNLAKVFARIDPRNIRSMRVLEKLGMKREGLLRSHVIRRGERADRMYYGLLRDEWEMVSGSSSLIEGVCHG